MNPQNIKVFIKSYLLKVTEFLDKMFQFETLAMTEKKCFRLYTFLPLKGVPPSCRKGEGGVHTMQRRVNKHRCVLQIIYIDFQSVKY